MSGMGFVMEAYRMRGSVVEPGQARCAAALHCILRCDCVKQSLAYKGGNVC